jgi:hypothetical protein
VQLSCGEHTDYGLLTFVNQEPGITALQVGELLASFASGPPTLLRPRCLLRAAPVAAAPAHVHEQLPGKRAPPPQLMVAC